MFVGGGQLFEQDLLLGLQGLLGEARAVAIDHDVLRLEVHMGDAVVMQGLHPLHDLSRRSHGPDSLGDPVYRHSYVHLYVYIYIYVLYCTVLYCAVLSCTVFC